MEALEVWLSVTHLQYAALLPASLQTQNDTHSIQAARNAINSSQQLFQNTGNPQGIKKLDTALQRGQNTIKLYEENEDLPYYCQLSLLTAH